MNARQRGFTLIEVVVALAVASLLVSLVYGAVRVGQRSAEAVNRLADQAETRRIGWDFLHRAITNIRAIPHPVDRENKTGFLGTEDYSSFVSDMPSYVGPGGLVKISLGIDADGEQRKLLLSYARYDRTSGEGSETELPLQATLVEKLNGLEMAYFGSLGETGAPGWHPEWTDPAQLPSLIRIVVKPEQGIAWPVIIARPIADSKTLETNDAAGADEFDEDALDKRPRNAPQNSGDNP